MGSAARVVFFAADDEAAREAERAVFARLDDLDVVMSDYRRDSELMRLCAAEAGVWHEVSDDLLTVLFWARSLAELTGGAFDPTVGPVVRLWREARRTGAMPDPAALEAARARVGYHHLEVDLAARSVRLGIAGMRLDLGGIGKGFAADEALRVLAGLGVRSALVDLGGDVVVSAPPPMETEALGWRVLVESGESGKTQEVLLAHAAVATSGDSEQFVIIDGERYSHLVDPRSGRALKGAASATVIARSGILADALASAACVLVAAGETGGAELGEAESETAPIGPAQIVSLAARFDEVSVRSIVWMRTVIFAGPDQRPREVLAQRDAFAGLAIERGRVWGRGGTRH